MMLVVEAGVDTYHVIAVDGIAWAKPWATGTSAWARNHNPWLHTPRKVTEGRPGAPHMQKRKLRPMLASKAVINNVPRGAVHVGCPS